MEKNYFRKGAEAITGSEMGKIQTYLRLTGNKPGYLLNFGEAPMKQGITRTTNNIVE